MTDGEAFRGEKIIDMLLRRVRGVLPVRVSTSTGM